MIDAVTALCKIDELSIQSVSHEVLFSDAAGHFSINTTKDMLPASQQVALSEDRLGGCCIQCCPLVR